MKLYTMIDPLHKHKDKDQEEVYGVGYGFAEALSGSGVDEVGMKGAISRYVVTREISGASVSKDGAMQHRSVVCYPLSVTLAGGETCYVYDRCLIAVISKAHAPWVVEFRELIPEPVKE